MRYLKLSVLVIFIFFIVASGSIAQESGNTTVTSFTKSKRVLLEDVYPDHLITFYCGNPFSADKKVIPSDAYTPKKDNDRAKRIEWEHIVPASLFGKQFPAWTDGHPECVTSSGNAYKGRRCATKMVEAYQFMQADIHNLVPAIGEINGLRSSYPYGILSGEIREFGNCDMEIENKTAEPPPNVRGNIARIYFYMGYVYPDFDIVDDNNRDMMNELRTADPVDEWECTRSKRIESLQGNENPFVKYNCIVNGMW